MTSRLSVSLRAISVRRGDTWALRNISLRLQPGERWALIGGNGAGKTQLLKVLSTAVWPTPTGSEARVFRLGRRTVDVITARPRMVYVGAELQDKYARYEWNLEVGDLLATGLHRTDLLQRLVTAEDRRRADAMLDICGLRGLRNRKFLSLSYGEKRVALLARGLIQDPDWLLLDEFYNGLDVDYRRRIDELLDRARANGQSWVAAAHRAADIPRGTRSVIELHAGRLCAVKRLRAADLARLAAQAEDTQPGYGGRLTPASTASRARARCEPAPPCAAAACGAAGAPWLLRITAADLYVEYRKVLQDLNWELRAGEHWAIFGANGAGKSSFLKLLYGDLSPALGGTIERRGFPRGTPIDAWKRQAGYVSPELQTDYAVDVTLLDLVASGRHASIGLSDPPTPADKRQARRWLRFFALQTLAERRPRELSYGQLRRALFARALAGNARILLLDEPLTGLDPRQRAAMKRLLERLMKRSITLIVAVHHAEDLPRGMTHALRLHGRRARSAPLDSSL